MLPPTTAKHDSPSGYNLPEDIKLPSSEGESQLLQQLQAILDKDPDHCRRTGGLPPGYYGEDCDFEEFFEPGLVLERVGEDPDWGLLDDPAESVERAHQLLPAIAATVDELHRAFNPGTPMSGRLRLRILEACRRELQALSREARALGVSQ